MSSLWDEGDIAQAVTKAKTQGAIFVVFIEGENELSTQYEQFFNNSDIVNTLKTKQFVAIKVKENSVPHQQFKSIYPHTSTPSVFFIGKSGKPLKIVSENIQVEEFKKIVETILETEGNVPASTSSEPTTVSDEKIQHAKELIEKKREEKKKEEEEAERIKEMERRKMGQSVQQMKRWQQDEELKQLKEERDKEKRENQAARERILAQIAQDKAERAAKFSPSPQSPKLTPQPRIEPKSDITRLQFRLPDGSSHTNDFQISDSLEIVHQYIRNEMNLPFVNYTLSTTFPRREFMESDNSQTLLDLQLVPNAVILIIPQNQGASVSSNGMVGSVFWWLLTPIFNMYNYLVGMIYGAPRRSVESTNSTKRPATEISGGSTRNVPKKQASDTTTTAIKRQGNIHRLKDRQDTDDDNNTWNGNSTQQM